MIFRPGATGQDTPRMGMVFDPTSLGISVLGSTVSGLIGSSAAGSAASTQANAANRASESAMDMYRQTREDLAPYRAYGVTAGNALSANLPTLTAPFDPTQATLEATPGYQFTLSQGLKAVQNAAAAKGLGISGAALRGAEDYATGLADNTLKTQFDIDQANKTNSFNKLLQLTNTGAGAATQTGNFGVQSTQNANNFATSGAAASAAGQVGSANALGGALTGAGNNYLNYSVANRLLGGY